MGHIVQTDLQLIEYSVDIEFDNCKVFTLDPWNVFPPSLNQEVGDWLECFGGDWGLENWYKSYLHRGEFGYEPGMDHVGKRFQFKDVRIATLFKLTWA